jgi:hypothetical protein
MEIVRLKILELIMLLENMLLEHITNMEKVSEMIDMEQNLLLIRYLKALEILLENYKEYQN